MLYKSLIVYGPQGCGKTFYKDRIAALFRLTTVIDGWALSEGDKPSPFNCLYLTNIDLRWAGNINGVQVISYENAMQLIDKAQIEKEKLANEKG